MAKEQDFQQFVGELAYGQAHTDFTEALRRVVAACQATRKKGKLTLTFTFVPAPKGAQIEVLDAYKIEEPQPDRETSVFYFARGGGLTRRDERQPELPPFGERTVNTKTGEISDAAAND